MFNKKEKEKPVIKKEEVSKDLKLSFPCYLYSKDGAVLFKDEKSYLGRDKSIKLQDTPFNKE